MPGGYDTEVIVPFRGGCEYRERAWEWVRSWWATTHPGWRVTVAEAPPGPWVKAAAVNPAVEASTADIVVIADADVISDGVAEAVLAAVDGAPWAIPHLAVRRLTEGATAALLAGGDTGRLAGELVEPAYKGVAGGGLVVLRRDVYLDCPLSPAFKQWGSEDHSWGYALRTLHGDAWRGDADLFHLWHPPEPRVNRRVGNAQSERLRRAYREARRDPAAMRALIEAGRAADVERADRGEWQRHR